MGISASTTTHGVVLEQHLGLCDCLSLYRAVRVDHLHGLILGQHVLVALGSALPRLDALVLVHGLGFRQPVCLGDALAEQRGHRVHHLDTRRTKA
jgi:hydrogenase maturation factor